MNLDQYVQEIVTLYQEAGKPLYPHERVYRGENRSISSQSEDLFARLLIDNLPQDTEIFINQILTAGSKELRVRIKPDLVIIRNQTIKAILDLKMDLGYKRDKFLIFWNKWDELVKYIRDEEFMLVKKSGTHKTRHTYRFSENGKLYFVLVSDQNINQTQLAPIKQTIGQKEHSDTIILTSRMHPNAFGLSREEALKRIEINNQQFDDFLIDLKERIK